MANVFSPLELIKLYNTIKLKYNPTGYSFKDRLIEGGVRDIEAEAYTNIGFDTERELLNSILKYWDKDVDLTICPDYGLCRTPSTSESDNLRRCYQTLKMEHKGITYHSDHPHILSYTDNLNIAPFNIASNFGINTEALKTNKIIEALVTICYLCTTPKSIVSDLKYIETNLPSLFTYENLHSFQFLKDSLENKNTDTLYTLKAINVLDNINCPTIPKEYEDHTCIGFADTTGLIEDIPTKEEYLNLLKHLYYETISFGLEIVYLINKYTDITTNNLIYTVLTGTMQDVSNGLTNLIYKENLKNFEPAISLDENAGCRFVQIYDYVHSEKVIEQVDIITKSLIARTGYTYIPSMLGAVISFAKHYSYRNIRIHQAAILYNYCNTNNLLDTSDYTVSDTVTDFLDSGFGKAVLETIETEEAVKSRSSLINLKKDTTGLSGGVGGSHISSNVSQALDGLINNFKTDKYKFTIKNVYSNSSIDKAKYDKIASSIKLVNTNLIKQIRDIKTYNVGGKYSGLPSGKLDKKALYKYKTDKNIFYQNTYKQKECDLAFGIVLDASGSMYGTGIENGRITMIVLHETLKALGVNHSIIDHTCYKGNYASDLRRYQCFKEDKGYNTTKNYALANITAESGNCDSGALWFMEKALLRTRNKDKICLIFSDGAPTECTELDLVEQVRHMEKNGIKVIGIGIDFPNISKYYPDYANGKNLKEMLDIVSKILKEYVLAKKD